MAQFVLVTTAALVIVYNELRPKWKGNKREFWVSVGFLGAGYVTLTLACFGVYLPSPLEPVANFIKWLFPV